MGRGPLPADLAAALDAGGEMGARIRDLDWAATPIGCDLDSWPEPLRHATVRMLASRAQIAIFWGADHVALYNDAYVPTMGDKHPDWLGCPGREMWSEAWEVLGRLFAEVAETGRSFWAADHPFMLHRHGFLEETYFDISYDPIRDDEGAVVGVFCIVSDTTSRVLGERRVGALSALGVRLADASGQADLGARVSAVLGENPNDVPFALLYLDDAGEPTPAGPGAPRPAGTPSAADRTAEPAATDTAVALVAAAGVPGATVLTPEVQPHTPGAGAALLRQVVAQGRAAQAPVSAFVSAVPEQSADEALVLPVTGGARTVGALVLGASRRLAVDQRYRDFFHLLAAQVSGAVTNQRAYELERARTAQLAALDRAKTNFFSNVSHEFRTPLTLILGPLEEALAGPDLSAADRDALELMHRNALRLLKLVNTVLDFSRIGSGRVGASYQPTDLSDYTARLAGNFRSAAERAGLRLDVDCPPLPAPVHLDREMWEKIVLNLLSNALKFTFAGRITVRTFAAGQTAVLEVSDTGVGIPERDLPLVFERFQRVVGRRGRSHEGTGIGLALVRELTELHGGRVAVDSRPDVGSTFTVTLPFGTGHLPGDQLIAGDVEPVESDTARLYLAEAERWAGAEPSPPTAVTAGRPGPSAGDDTGRAGHGGRILVADDNADLRDHLTRLLSPTFEVVAVADGVAAVEAAARGAFDLVITDVMMPRMDGVELVAALRADPRTRHLPIVMLSARAGETAAVEGLTAGADDYLVKPFSGQELIARVRSNVELGQLRGQIIRQLRALTDAAVAVNTAQSTAEVTEAAARHAQLAVRAARVVVSVPGAHFEADAGGDLPADPPLVVPLLGMTGGPFGELRVWPHRGTVADAEEEALAQLARLVGVRLDNARLYEAEHRIAMTLQHSLLPQSLPQLPGAIVASRYLAGNSEVEVGGDWYDAIPVDDGRLVLVIGDVVGKGVVAAAAMGQLRNALRAYVLEGFDPGAALTRLNRLIGTVGRRSFATVVCVRFDPVTGRLWYASAGHPPPALIGADGSARFLYAKALGPPVGALPDAGYVTVEGRLDPGARILLYTDGLVEDRRQGIDDGLAQLLADAARPTDHVDDLVEAMVGRVAGRTRRDDVAVLALEAAEPDRLVLRLPTDPARLSVLRRRLENFLTGHGVPENDVFDLIVAVSEAAANAMEHPVEPAQDTIEVEVTIGQEAVTAVVRDSGRWRESDGAGFRGRGLALIGALAELTVHRSDEGTTVTVHRRLGG
ncbi:SpoIIE family protein phosphatase [Polymorphospora rubra]|uniref:SpoIIE family protein phosphatase n=1 Tax=Polymorphospora rubra TaxID=338584 RepID=UPI0033C198DC